MNQLLLPFTNSRRIQVKSCIAIALLIGLVAGLLTSSQDAVAQKKSKSKNDKPTKVVDGKNIKTGKPDPGQNPVFEQYGIYENKAPRAAKIAPIETTLPLQIAPDSKIALIGNTLIDRSRKFGHFETLLQQMYPEHKLVVRNLAWSADEITLQPRPSNFADLEQHLTYEKIDIIFAAYGFNESFAGQAGMADFEENLKAFVKNLKSKAYNGESAPQVVLLSPIANESIEGVNAAELNNGNIEAYTKVMEQVASAEKVGFVDLFAPTLQQMQPQSTQLTINGSHLTSAGYDLFAKSLIRDLVGTEPPPLNEEIRKVVVDKNRQFFRRYRPLNTFYYTGGRNKAYGYLDFLPAMKNFEMLVANRDQRIWDLAQGKEVATIIDDTNLPHMPNTSQSRGANEWMSAADELKAFDVDPRFEVNLFAGEEEFPDIAAPIQMRWDSRGRLWVSCSTTYPHVYPGGEPNDKLVILEDTDGDGKADKSTVFADDLHIPLSFEFGDGGVYVSEQPDLTFLKDTDGDDRADVHRTVLTGFGTEDSHHSLHDFVWTPDGDLLFRESIFHHSQVETPYGPVRQQNSGWFKYEPAQHRLTSFGTYHSTNPWGVTFDHWGQHVASHPVYAQAFHSVDPPYPTQHPKPAGLQAYSGTCGQEFVDFASFPKEMQGNFIKVRYKPTNRVEIHKWNEGDFGYEEEYVSDLIFSRNLSFIPVDLGYGPRGAMYVCDWYNPIKGHAQYSLRDDRRDRHSGRIWRITAKDRPLAEPINFAEASVEELVETLERPEYRNRYWAKREIRERNPEEVRQALESWEQFPDGDDPRFEHHLLEALWTYRGIDVAKPDLIRLLLTSDNHHARAAATHQIRYLHNAMPDAMKWLRQSMNDQNGIVRMEAAIVASYIGTQEAFNVLLDVLRHPRDGHLAYAIACAFGSHTMRQYWESDNNSVIAKLLKQASKNNSFKEPTPAAQESQFDSQANLKKVRIGCVPERMKFTVERIDAKPGQPVKIVFFNPDATDHNLLVIQPGALAEVGMAANEMAKDPKNANSNFHPPGKDDLIVSASPMIGPTRKTQVHVMRFMAPKEPGIYPYVCTFPGHWVIMNGNMVVANSADEAEQLLAAAKPKIVKEWKLEDFKELDLKFDEQSIMKGYMAFAKARCNQCHVHSGHGVNLGPELTKIGERFKDHKLLQQIIDPSIEINKKYQTWQFVTNNGEIVSGVIKQEDDKGYHIMTNLLTPNVVKILPHRDIEFRAPATLSSMPVGMLNVLTKIEIEQMIAFLQSGGYKLPEHLKHHHGHDHKH
jgi:putative heme-binding domain-containing protein